MNVLFDTSVLVAAVLPTHPHHHACQRWLDAAIAGKFGFFVAAHSITEFYRVLTAMKLTPQRSTQQIWSLLDLNILQHATVIGLNVHETIACIDRVAQSQQRSGIVYDALIAECAIKTKVDHLLTLNEKHFTRVWPNHAGEVINPLTTQAP